LRNQVIAQTFRFGSYLRIFGFIIVAIACAAVTEIFIELTEFRAGFAVTGV